jgi:proline dehydrogenase
MRCIIDILGKYNRDEKSANESYISYIELAREIEHRRLKASLAVKPSTLGGTVGRELTQKLVRGIGEEAANRKVGFELDIEGQRLVDLTLQVAEECARSGMPVTVALQAYLNRTAKDIERMVDGGVKVRLVKGAYTGDINDFNMIAEVYRDLVEQIISYDLPFCVATHDPDLLEWVQTRLRDRDLLEFSFLKGLSDVTKDQLVWEGWNVTEYVPYGANKEGYETRRKTYLRKLDELGRQPAP